MMVPLADKDRRFLLRLNDKLNYWTAVDRFGLQSFLPTESVLSDEEWERVERLIREHELPCEMTTMWGFSYRLHVLDHSPVPQALPESLLLVHARQTPFFDEKDRERSSNEAWERFSAFTHSERNREMARFYGIREPMPRGRYEY